MSLIEDRKSLPMIAVAALVAVIFWSLKPVFITEIGDSASYLEVYVIAGAFSVAASAVGCLLQPRATGRLLSSRRSLYGAGQATISGLCLAAWYYGFYRALYGSAKVDATIIAFSWPLIAIFAMRIFAPSHGRRLTLSQFALIFVAFMGAIAIGLAGISTASFSGRWEILFAFVAALGSGFYLPFAVNGSKRMGEVVGSGIRGTFFTISLANLVALAVVLALTFGTGTTLRFYAVDAKVLLICATIGVATYLLAEITWTWAFSEYESLTLSSLPYFSPALSVVMLFVFYDEPVAPLSAFGLMLILFSNMTLHGTYHSSNAVISALIGTLYVALATIFVEPGDAGNLTDLLYFVSGLFAILAGFILSRVSSRRSEELDQRSLFVRAMIDLGRDAPAAMDVVDRTLMDLVDLEFAPDAGDKGRLSAGIRRRIDGLAEVPPERRSYLLSIFDLWFTIHFDRLSLGEKAALWITGLTSILLLVVVRGETVMAQLGLYAFAAGCLLVIFTIYDYERNNVHGFRKHLFRMEEGFREIGRAFYLPARLVESGEFTSVLGAGRMRYREDDGRIREVEVTPQRGGFRHVYWMSGALLMISLFMLPFSVIEDRSDRFGRTIRPEVIGTQVSALFRQANDDIIVGQFDWDLSRVIASVLEQSIERRFDVEVGIRTTTVSEILPDMVDDGGRIDVHPDFWTGNQPRNVAEYVDVANGIALNTRPYIGTQGIFVTRAAAEQAGIDEVSDLGDPRIAAHFDEDGDGRAEIWTGAPAWQSTELAEAWLTSRGLGEGLDYQRYSDRVFKAKLESYIEAGRPLLFYGYMPDWIHSEFDLLRLAEDGPAACIEPADIVPDPPRGGAPRLCGLPSTRVHVGVAPRVIDGYPEIARFLLNVSFPIDDLNDWLRGTSRLETTPEEIARDWIEAHGDVVAGWAAPG